MLMKMGLKGKIGILIVGKKYISQMRMLPYLGLHPIGCLHSFMVKNANSPGAVQGCTKSQESPLRYSFLIFALCFYRF
jgi:hypothetical protein